MASKILKQNPEIIPLLGIVRDCEIMERFGCSRETVQNMRLALGIRRSGSKALSGETPPTRVRHSQKWTAAEDTIVWAGVKNKTRVAEIIEQLGRSRSYSSIENRKRILRFLKMRKCRICSEPLPEGHKRVECPACIEKQKVYSKNLREGYLREGRCGSCGVPIDTWGSLTMCSECLAKARSYQKGTGAGHNQGIVRWVGSAGGEEHLSRLPPEHGIVDLFGGAGFYTIRAATLGCPIRVYNEVNPGMFALVSVLQEGRLDELMKVARTLKNLSPVLFEKLYQALPQLPQLEQAAVFFMAAQSTKNAGLAALNLKDKLYSVPKDVKRRLRPKISALQGVRLTRKLWDRALAEMDVEDRVFFLDPPYPGTAFFRHNMDLAEHEYLVQRLMGLRGKFYLVYGVSRAAAVLMKPIPYVYRVKVIRGHYFIRELVGTNYPIAGLEPLDFEHYGL
jgi:DNA adenine methylase